MELARLLEHVLEYSTGEQSLRGLPTGGGVYLLTDARDRPIQLAAAADLKRALRHRLVPSEPEAKAARTAAPAAANAAEDPLAGSDAVETALPSGRVSPPAQTAAGAPRQRRLNLEEIVRRIWWTPAHSQFELTFAYYRIARTLMPHTYRRQVAFGPAWFVHVDLTDRLPRFVSGRFLRAGAQGRPEARSGEPLSTARSAPLPVLSDRMAHLYDATGQPARGTRPPGEPAEQPGSGVDLGPFATQTDAARFIEIVQDAFDLCRYHHILERAPRGQACAYYEMGKCPAPCDGSIPLERYREMIADALRFASGQRGPAYGRIESAMRAAAAARQYERAAVLKKQLERARGIEHAAFARVAPIESLNLLVLQRGAGTTQIKPFFVRCGAIAPGPPVKRAAIRDALAAWRAALAEPPAPMDLEERSEHIWLLSHFLFKPDPPGLYLSPTELADEVAVLGKLEEKLGPGRKSAAGPQDERELKDSA